jgi:hypothetical protein
MSPIMGRPHQTVEVSHSRFMRNQSLYVREIRIAKARLGVEVYNGRAAASVLID